MARGILVGDASTYIRAPIVKFLRERGYEASGSVCNVKSALDELEFFRQFGGLDLLIFATDLPSDCKYNGGLQILRMLRGEIKTGRKLGSDFVKCYQKTPVILMHYEGCEPKISTGAEVRIHLLPKVKYSSELPVDEKQLMRLVKRYMPKQASHYTAQQLEF